MASSKQQHLLRQLLNEDQEPFVLKNYINERKCQLKRTTSSTTQQHHHHSSLQLKRRRPISENPSFFCKNACFLSFHDSPDIRKSPLFDFSSPAKSPCRNGNTLFVHIPSRTAALLLEAALRIQKQSTAKKPKNIGFGFFGSMLKRITHRKRNQKRNTNGDEEDDEDEINVSMKEILRWDSNDARRKTAEKKLQGRRKSETRMGLDEETSRVISEVGYSCSCNSRLSSAAWSESNEEKSLDLETSSSRSEDSDEMGDFHSDFCSSPFRFVLQTNSSPGRCTPEFASPSRLKKQVVKNDEQQLNFEEEEEKEQFSPVSVLDPPFEEDDEDDDDEDRQDEDDEEDRDRFELDRSFAVVQRARQQLLHKLRRFERLAELDPIELEKRMAEEGDEDEDLDDDEDDDDSVVTDDTDKGDSFVREVLSGSHSGSTESIRIPSDMKRLVLDLVAEEKVEGEDKEMLASKVSRRLDSWKYVESNTIDMMVELDFRREGEEWRKNREELVEAAVEIEMEIFSFLVKELSEELIQSS